MKQVIFFLPNIRQLKVKIWIWSTLIRHSRSNVTFVFFDVTLNSNSSNISLLMLFFRINFNGIQIVNNNVPSKILCSASICQYVIPEVDGDSERGLCWSITRIRKWTNKEIKQNETNENNHLTKYFYIIRFPIPDHVYSALTVFCDTILKQALCHKIGLEFFMKEAYDWPTL